LRQLAPDAVFLTRRDGDLREWSEVKRLFREYQPESVIHLAARVAGVKSNATKNADLYCENIQINTNVMDAAREYQVSRLVSVLSACAYPEVQGRAASEDDLHNGTHFKGNLGYGFSKRMLDLHTRLLWEQYGCRFSSITPVTVYGPNDNWDLDEGHVIGALIHKCFLAKQNHRPFEIWGSGNAVRQFIFSADVARILLKSLSNFWGPDTIIVAPDTGISIRELAGHIAKIMAFQGLIQFNPNKPEGQRIRIMKSKRFSKIFGHPPFTPLEQGLEETIRWFIRHRELTQGKNLENPSLSGEESTTVQAEILPSSTSSSGLLKSTETLTKGLHP
ncbi:MAG: NAD-dependent epimerase/dehydratase family protein, partial [Candidatus Omnitrophica bacterium]|nr:NAD-dependent epimerase/dehydratase family protein [Candidatus Omnitrophota bacterium]